MRYKKMFPPVKFQSQPEPEPEPPPGREVIIRQRIARFFSRFRHVFMVFLGVVIAFAAITIWSMTQPLPQRLTQRDIDAAVERTLANAKPKPSMAAKAYEVIRPSVVRVVTRIDLPDGKKDGGLGTGVVVDDAGTILTCYHVIRGATEVKVIFSDGSESVAKILVQQPENDLAVLAAKQIPDDLIPATLAGSAGLQVGDEVVAVGNPFGISNSVSAGVVSGLRRSFKSEKTGISLFNLIQFDAAVNPGNSGGPLVNRDGEVVGIVSALLNPNDEDVFIGIGFAVPLESAGGVIGSPPY